MSENLSFTFHAPRVSLTTGINAYNALAVDGESRILIVGNECDDAARNALTEAFASDGGTVVLSEDAPASALRANVNYVCAKAKRKAIFAKITADTVDAPTVGYAVTLRAQ